MIYWSSWVPSWAKKALITNSTSQKNLFSYVNDADFCFAITAVEKAIFELNGSAGNAEKLRFDIARIWRLESESLDERRRRPWRADHERFQIQPRLVVGRFSAALVPQHAALDAGTDQRHRLVEEKQARDVIGAGLNENFVAVLRCRERFVDPSHGLLPAVVGLVTSDDDVGLAAIAFDVGLVLAVGLEKPGVKRLKADGPVEMLELLYFAAFAPARRVKNV